MGTHPDPDAQAFVQFRAGQARSCAYKLRNSGAALTEFVACVQGARSTACARFVWPADDGVEILEQKRNLPLSQLCSFDLLRKRVPLVA